LPMAVQIGCALRRDSQLLQVAHAFESAIGWRFPMLLA
jgi:Asp-tRNA(Asn)/Glu-tRNA(Gln) amidotransferase A subunit family amidase